MTCYSCATKCFQNCEFTCFDHSIHTNKTCHLKKSYKDSNRYRTMSPEYVYKEYNQTKKPGYYKEKLYNQNYEICCSTNHHGKEKKQNLPRNPKRNICELCCCIVDNCKCKDNNVERDLRPRTLCEDLPLYDERAHLLGYIKRGSIIDMPFCINSQDQILEEKSAVNNAHPRLPEGTNFGCMSSCRYAEGVRKQYTGTSMSRWTTQTAFDHATRTSKPTTLPYEKQKTFPCPCGK